MKSKAHFVIEKDKIHLDEDKDHPCGWCEGQ